MFRSAIAWFHRPPYVAPSENRARQTSAMYANIPQPALERAQTQAPLGGRALQQEKDEEAAASFLSSAGESELFLLFNLLQGVRSANRGKLLWVGIDCFWRFLMCLWRARDGFRLDDRPSMKEVMNMDMEQTASWETRLRSKKQLEMFTAKYYAACAAGGMISAGSVHFLITPFDMMKVNMQAYPLKYRSIASTFGTVYREQGMAGIWKGWSSKLFGYSAQGACKFSLYEYFKKSTSDRAGPAFTQSNPTLIYMASSLPAQVIADVALCPFESVKVRVQTHPGFAKGVSDGFPKLYATEGITGFYKGLLPLWARNLPFAMLMFTSFEHSVNFIYGHVLNRHKSECSLGTQLGVTCMAGYMSGVAGTIISNPADNILTALYNKKGSTSLQAARRIGIVGLFTRSLPLRVMLVGPLVTAQWFCYDTCKVLSGLPTSGGDTVKRAEIEAS